MTCHDLKYKNLHIIDPIKRKKSPIQVHLDKLEQNQDLLN